MKDLFLLALEEVRKKAQEGFLLPEMRPQIEKMYEKFSIKGRIQNS